MFSSCLVRSLLHLSSASNTINPSQCRNLLLPSPFVSSLRFFASGDSNRQEQPFTVSYLVEKCGLSEEAAQSAAKSISFTSPERPDSVMDFLRNQGFSPEQTLRVVTKLPKVLSSGPEKNLLPKLDFLRSKGFSEDEVRKVISGSPWILRRSLKAHIVPSFDFFSNLIGTERKARSTIRRYPTLLALNTQAEIVPKMELFREHGVSEKNFGLFLFCQPRHVMTSPDRLKAIMEQVRDFGISPSHVNFVIGVGVIGGLSQQTWDWKLEIYSRWGWSKEATIRAFGKYPRCMLVSESKIMAVMDYYTKEMGLESSFIAERPLLLLMSLKKKIIPRCSVIKAVRSKQLTGHIGLTNALCIPEAKFLEKFVNRFPEESNNLLDLYNEKMGKADEGTTI